MSLDFADYGLAGAMLAMMAFALRAMWIEYSKIAYECKGVITACKIHIEGNTKALYALSNSIKRGR